MDYAQGYHFFFCLSNISSHYFISHYYSFFFLSSLWSWQQWESKYLNPKNMINMHALVEKPIQLAIIQYIHNTNTAHFWPNISFLALSTFCFRDIPKCPNVITTPTNAKNTTSNLIGFCHTWHDSFMCTIRATRWTPSSLSGSCSRFDISMADGISLAPPSSSTIGLVLFGYWPFWGGEGTICCWAS